MWQTAVEGVSLTSLIEGTNRVNGLITLFSSYFPRAPSLAFPQNYGVIMKERNPKEIIKLSSKEAPTVTFATKKILINFLFRDDLQGDCLRGAQEKLDEKSAITL